MAQTVTISKPYITIAQFLKVEGLIGTGGQAKWFLQENQVLINDTEDSRRGRKLYPGDVLRVLNQTYQIQKQE